MPSFNQSNIVYSGKTLPGNGNLARQLYVTSLFYKNFKPQIGNAIKCQYNLFDLSNNLEFVAYANCPTTFPHQATVNQKNGSVCRIQMRDVVNYDSLLCTAYEDYYSTGMNVENILQIKPVINAYIEKMLEEAAFELDNIFLNGDTTLPPGYLSLCDGLIKKLLADPLVIDVANVPITPLNVIAQMQLVYDAIPDVVKYGIYSNKTKIAVSGNIYQAYLQALYTSGVYLGLNPLNMQSTVTFNMLEVVVSPTLPNDTMIATYSDNIWMITDNATDVENIQIYDKGRYSSCKQVEFFINMAIAADYSKPEYIVLYS